MVSHTFSLNSCQPSFKKLIVKNKDEVDIDIIPRKKEKYLSVTYGCISLLLIINSYAAV